MRCAPLLQDRGYDYTLDFSAPMLSAISIGRLSRGQLQALKQNRTIVERKVAYVPHRSDCAGRYSQVATSLRRKLTTADAVFEARGRQIELVDPDAMGATPEVFSTRCPSWAFAPHDWRQPPALRLFNLRSDPKEETDVKDFNPGVKSVIDKIVTDFKASTTAFPNVPMDAPDPYIPASRR
jgi:hypothetical protein